MSQSQAHAEHITGPKTYGAILLALMVLTIVTVQASYIDFGSMNTVVALVIATVKGSLVALFFMHLRHDKFNAVIFVGGLLFLSIFLIWTLFDLSTRETILPSNLKAPIAEFPGAPLNKPVRPSTGQPAGVPAP
ncbi:cytochrome C oxidase subunit IV family protein [uncultured Paludibaculum sp.]|uniref:cytochrome C oxidase subunit IV family protein n=1 Tax=uncultured Paludibaculum sp. TaxID=1765020 RepID=UPI002AAAD559|nr:cytochrome C oxidase subunit IV family protein [uncultured Paludibaculum sp.]